MVKLREDQFAEANIHVHKGVEIVHIDRANKVLTDSLGQEHTYDRLMLGMGSRAFMPPSVPKISGIFNMRSRIDADSLMPFLQQPNPHAVIVGGGLLGLELAASLREMNIEVTVIQRSGRFMDRQLDKLGSEMLHHEIVDLGIEVFYNDEVSSIYGTDQLEGVRLKSGRRIDAQVAVFAIGTTPNTEIAKAAGLEVKRGVVVNDYLQTSDPSIFAAGEIGDESALFIKCTEFVLVILVGMVQGNIQYQFHTTGFHLRVQFIHQCPVAQVFIHRVEIPRPVTVITTFTAFIDVIHQWRYPNGGDTQGLQVIEFGNQAFNITTPILFPFALRAGTFDCRSGSRVSAVVVIGIAIGETIHKHKVHGARAEIVSHRCTAA